MRQENDKDTDVLWGARCIGQALGLTDHQARHRIAKGEIPTFKIGGTICARRSTLSIWLSEQEIAATKQAACK